MTIDLTTLSRVIAFCAGWWLIGTGIDAISAQSKNTSEWEYESSFVALSYRQQGRLGVGIGLLSMASSVVGLKVNENKEPSSKD